MSAKRRRRRPKGATIVEFGSGLSMLVCFFVVPLIDIAFVPARYMLVRGYMENVVHHMALCEKRSDAISYIKSPAWKSFIDALGVTVKSADANLVVCDNSGTNRLALSGEAPVPDEYLPNAPQGPSVYEMELNMVVEVPPLFKSKIGMPGFTSPVTMSLQARSHWENLSPDAQTSDYYMNE